MSAQIIEHNGRPAFAVVPIAEWTELQARLEALQDIADAKSACDAESFPVEFADRLLAGESPLKVWRDYRGLTLQALAAPRQKPIARARPPGFKAHSARSATMKSAGVGRWSSSSQRAAAAAKSPGVSPASIASSASISARSASHGARPHSRSQ